MNAGEPFLNRPPLRVCCWSQFGQRDARRKRKYAQKRAPATTLFRLALLQASLNNPAGFPAISASKQPCGVGCTSTRPRSSVLIWAGTWAMSRRAAPKVCDELAVMIRCAGQHRRYFVHCPGVHVEPVARLFT